MKKVYLTIFIAVLVLILSWSAEARERVTFSNELIVDLVKYDPSPVRPGFSVGIWFEVNNIAKEPLEKVRLSLVEEFPFSIPNGEEQTFSLGKDEKKQIKFTVNVNPNAKDLDYNIFLQYFSEKANMGYSKSFSIPVKRIGVEMGVTDVNIEPEIIPPGEKAIVNVVLENNADYLMKDITLEISLDSTTLPFAPTGTTTKKKIKELPPGKGIAVDFDIIVTPSAEAGVYKVPLIIQYYDELGHSFNKSELLGLTVGSDPEIYVEIKEKEIYSSRGTGSIVLNIVNKGLTDIKLLKVTLGSSEEYELLSSDSVYIGDIDSDDEETAEFRLELKGSTEVVLPVKLEYRDANNRPNTQEENIILKIYSKSMMGKGSNTGTIIWIVVIIAAVAVVAYYYLHRKKKI